MQLSRDQRSLDLKETFDFQFQLRYAPIRGIEKLKTVNSNLTRKSKIRSLSKKNELSKKQN